MVQKHRDRLGEHRNAGGAGPLHHPRERLALHVLHCEEGKSLRRGAAVDQACDIRMLEPCQNLALQAKTAKFSAHVPRKLLLLLLSCTAIGFVATLLSGVDALILGPLFPLLPTMLSAVILSGAGTVYFGKIWLDRRKAEAGEGTISQ